MGHRARRSAIFRSQHPRCCFCGGDAQTVEIDHIPSRAFFHNREWPEGYVFPACVDCNRGTAADEQFVASIARSHEFDHPEWGSEVQGLVRGAAAKLPEATRALLTVRNRDVRKMAREVGVPRSYFRPYGQLAVMNVSHPLVRSIIQRFGLKVICALHYKHTGRIIPPEGGVIIEWRSDFQVANGALPESLKEIATGLPPITRGKINLKDQFVYRYEVSDDGHLGLYVVKIHRWYYIGFVSFDPAVLPDGKGNIIHPFRSEAA